MCIRVGVFFGFVYSCWYCFCLGSKSKPNDDLLIIFRPILAQGVGVGGWGEGVPKINKKKQQLKNAKEKNEHEQTRSFELRDDFLKKWRAQRLDVDRGSMNKSDKHVI